ncbi:MAG TPA: hypothetical protein V6D10_00380, partial [Trichocoleus sp.]
MTWKGIHPIVKLNSQLYSKGISLTKTDMRSVEKRLERNPELPKWDILCLASTTLPDQFLFTLSGSGILR